MAAKRIGDRRRELPPQYRICAHCGREFRELVVLTLLATVLVLTFACGGGGEEEGAPTPTPTATPTPTLTPTPTQCEADRHAVQAALYAYYEEKEEWPTETGEPGDIEWGKLVLNFLPSIPATDKDCDWSVNSNPEGEVCVGQEVGCIPCKCRCGTGCAQ